MPAITAMTRFGLVERHPVAAARSHEVAAAGGAAGERLLLPEPILAGIGRRDGHERQVAVALGFGVERLLRADRDVLDLAAERLEEPGLGPEPRQRPPDVRRQLPDRRQDALIFLRQLAAADDPRHRTREPERPDRSQTDDGPRDAEARGCRAVAAQADAAADSICSLGAGRTQSSGCAGSTNTSPAISSRKARANTRITIPPNEWPTIR